MVYVVVVPVTGKVTVVEGPVTGEKITPAALLQVTGPPDVMKKAVHPSQVCEGPLIFNTGFIHTFKTLLPLQFFLSGF